MELIHTINGVIIEEPIGFDQLKMTLQRTEYHGISAEVSQLDLEFYGKAATIIKEAYETDLDTELNYIVTNNGVEVYNGMVDLSTYQETEGSYLSVSCKVGEIGVKTIFNNRNETEVDLNSDTTIDGEELAMRPTWRSLHIPTKHLPYTNLFTQEETKTYDTISPIGANKGKHFIPIHFENRDVNEYGTCGTSERVMDCELVHEGSDIITPGAIPLANDTNMCVFEEGGTEFEEKFGENTTHTTIKIRATVGVTLCDDILPDKDFYPGNNTEGHAQGNRYYVAKLVLMQEDGTIVWEAKGTANIAPGRTMSVHTINIDWDGDPEDDMASTETINDIPTSQRLYFGVLLETDWRFVVSSYEVPVISSEPLNNECTPTITIYKNSYIKTLMFDNLQDETKNTNMLMVYDALKTISLMTTENQLPVKSDWYNYSDLSGNIVAQHGGATKAITNGYKIRDIKTESGKEYPMSMSFRNLFESLNAMDCIGWSIVNEEDGLCLRVERWDWFYKDEEVLTIEDANELKTSLNKDLCVTEFEIGYDKYVTSDVYNSIENLHSERKFASAVKALSNKMSAKSKIIADNYAIEETRRAQFQVKPSESFEHDESVFVFELGAGGLGGSFIIRSSAEDCVGIKRPAEFINAKLTPRQCAARWADYLFAMNGAKALKYVTSSANSEAGFSTNSGSLLLSMADNPQMENGDIERKPHKLKAETLEFTYPLTIEKYKKIKNNPYGLIAVNGIQGWIKEFTYSFVDGEAEFKLTPKAH